MRFCWDFWPKNYLTIKVTYPLPRIDENWGKAMIYTSIDLAWPFRKIPVRMSDRRKTEKCLCLRARALWMETNAFWNVECFRCNQKSESPSATKNCKAWRKHGNGLHWCHYDRLREVFVCLRKAGFKMRVATCDFVKSEIKCLCRIVTAKVVKPDPTNGFLPWRTLPLVSIQQQLALWV